MATSSVAAMLRCNTWSRHHPAGMNERSPSPGADDALTAHVADAPCRLEGATMFARVLVVVLAVVALAEATALTAVFVQAHRQRRTRDSFRCRMRIRNPR